jgi:hypothetical protein
VHKLLVAGLLTDRVPPDLGEQLAWEASRAFAAYWLAECRKIEEEIENPSRRWAILVEALAVVSRRGR